jgi:hypothetical protein
MVGIGQILIFAIKNCEYQYHSDENEKTGFHPRSGSMAGIKAAVLLTKTFPYWQTFLQHPEFDKNFSQAQEIRVELA